MKLLLTLALLFAGSEAHAEKIALSTYLAVESSQNTSGFPSSDHWCVGEVSGVDFRNFEAARQVLGMAAGLYECQGEFLIRDFEIQVFSVSTCEKVDTQKLFESCQKN